LISRKGNGLSRPNFDLNPPNDRRVSGNWRFEMQFKSFAEIVESFFLSLSLAQYQQQGIAKRSSPPPAKQLLRTDAS